MKNKILPIILSIIVVGIMIGLVFIVQHKQIINENGTITICLYSEERELISRKEIRIKKGIKFIDIIKENYDIELKNGTLLVKIDKLEARDTVEKFIKIYHNCSPSKYGVNQMKVKDHDEIVFIIEKTKVDGDLNDNFC